MWDYSSKYLFFDVFSTLYMNLRNYDLRPRKFASRTQQSRTKLFKHSLQILTLNTVISTYVQLRLKLNLSKSKRTSDVYFLTKKLILNRKLCCSHFWCFLNKNINNISTYFFPICRKITHFSIYPIHTMLICITGLVDYIYIWTNEIFDLYYLSNSVNIRLDDTSLHVNVRLYFCVKL